MMSIGWITTAAISALSVIAGWVWLPTWAACLVGGIGSLVLLTSVMVLITDPPGKGLRARWRQ